MHLYNSLMKEIGKSSDFEFEFSHFILQLKQYI